MNYWHRYVYPYSIRSGERKMMQPIRIVSGLSTRIKKWNQFSQIQMSIYQSNTIEKT